jgi:dienelactone hydrolase
MASSWEKITVDNSVMRAYLCTPDRGGKVPGIVVVQGQTGVGDFVEFARMVAAEGFVAAAPDLYHRDPPDCKDDPPTRRMRLTDRTVVADIKAGVMYYGGDTFSPWGDGPSPFERTAQIHCPILGHFGADDKNPSPDDMRRLDAEMTRLGKPHEFHSYANAAHAFANFGSGAYREHAAKASWPRTFDFFREQLQAR